MLFMVLALAAIILTTAMFLSKSSMLGFPCLIFWAIMGGYCYQQSTAAWDIYYLTFFGSFGMVIFSMLAMYGLRTRKEELAEGDEFIDEGSDDTVFIDEGGSESGAGDTEPELPRNQAQSVRDRARRRRDAIKRRRFG